MQLSNKFYGNRKLQSLVENQTSYTLNNAALHIFETHAQAEKVILEFDQPVLASMLKGKKIMHLRERQAFDFLPGESLILPSNCDIATLSAIDLATSLALPILSDGATISPINLYLPLENREPSTMPTISNAAVLTIPLTEFGVASTIPTLSASAFANAQEL